MLQANAPLADFEIWPENLKVLELFFACRSQWRILAGFERNTYLGLDYAGVKMVMECYMECATLVALSGDESPHSKTLSAVETAHSKTLFADLQIMEWAALEVLNEGSK